MALLSLSWRHRGVLLGWPKKGGKLTKWRRRNPVLSRTWNWYQRLHHSRSPQEPRLHQGPWRHLPPLSWWYMCLHWTESWILVITVIVTGDLLGSTHPSSAWQYTQDQFITSPLSSLNSVQLSSHLGRFVLSGSSQEPLLWRQLPGETVGSPGLPDSPGSLRSNSGCGHVCCGCHVSGCGSEHGVLWPALQEKKWCGRWTRDGDGEQRRAQMWVREFPLNWLMTWYLKYFHLKAYFNSLNTLRMQ